jgi:hypothetical protein
VSNERDLLKTTPASVSDHRSTTGSISATARYREQLELRHHRLKTGMTPRSTRVNREN